MSAANVFQAIELAEHVAEAIVTAIPGLDRARVLHVARESVANLPPAGPDQAGAWRKARAELLGDQDERSEIERAAARSIQHDTAPPKP